MYGGVNEFYKRYSGRRTTRVMSSHFCGVRLHQTATKIQAATTKNSWFTSHPYLNPLMVKYTATPELRARGRLIGKHRCGDLFKDTLQSVKFLKGVYIN